MPHATTDKRWVHTRNFVMKNVTAASNDCIKSNEGINSGAGVRQTAESGDLAATLGKEQTASIQSMSPVNNNTMEPKHFCLSGTGTAEDGKQVILSPKHIGISHQQHHVVESF